MKHFLLSGDNWQRISHLCFSKEKKTAITAESIEIKLAEDFIERKGEDIKLTATKFNLLAYLAANAGHVLTHRSTLSQVWDQADADHVEYLRVFVRQLLKKFGRRPRATAVHPQQAGDRMPVHGCPSKH